MNTPGTIFLLVCCLLGLVVIATAGRVAHKRGTVDPAAWEAGVQNGKEKLRHKRPGSWLTVLRRKPEYLGSDRPGRHSERHFALINDETRVWPDSDARRLNDLLTDWERKQ
ncbi:MAG: hypothetical protein ACRDQH_01375 [Pseudonocardiaceae bacterium]